MPKNRVISYGGLLLLATILIWLGAELARRIYWLLPYGAGIGIAMVAGGAIYQWWLSRESTAPRSRDSEDARRNEG